MELRSSAHTSTSRLIICGQPDKWHHPYFAANLPLKRLLRGSDLTRGRVPAAPGGTFISIPCMSAEPTISRKIEPRWLPRRLTPDPDAGRGGSIAWYLNHWKERACQRGRPVIPCHFQAASHRAQRRNKPRVVASRFGLNKRLTFVNRQK
jgi:hypothetical protein